MSTANDAEKTAYQLEPLIVTAFTAARDRGKPDWRRMTTAVLKNRLLQLSRNHFHESHHGATSLRELLARYPQLVKIDHDHVELIDASVVEEPTSGFRVRQDLWKAIVDYSSGTKYAWDRASEIVREALPGDEVILPTLTREEMAAWRTEFVIENGSPMSLQHWRDRSLGNFGLPSPFRERWNQQVKLRVVRRLEEWFRARGLTSPKIREGIVVGETAPSASLQQLRDLVAACVLAMTEEELAELRLPPAAVLRAQLKKRHP